MDDMHLFFRFLFTPLGSTYSLVVVSAQAISCCNGRSELSPSELCSGAARDSISVFRCSLGSASARRSTSNLSIILLSVSSFMFVRSSWLCGLQHLGFRI